MHCRLLALAFLGCMTASAVTAQPLPSTQVTISPTKLYLMAYHACERSSCSNPRNHSVYLAESDDGRSWTGVPGWTPYAGSVPDIVRRDNTLYIYTASSFVTRYNLETGTLDRVSLTVNGYPNGTGGFVDPSLVVDDQNRLVMFMMYAEGTAGDPASCGSGVSSCTKQFLSATEVAGSNGTQFTVDSGTRATVTVTSGSSASDPDIFVDGSTFVMYISHGASFSVWTSSELRGTYTRSTVLSNGLLSNQRGGVPAGHYDRTTGEYWTYVHIGESGRSVIRRALHRSLTEPISDAGWTTVLTAASMGLSATMSVESPGFTTLDVVKLQPNPACSAMQVPSAVSATQVGSTIEVAWAGSAGATSYLVEVGTAPGASDTAAIDTGSTDPRTTLRGLAAGTYYLRVRSRNPCETSSASEEIRVVLR